jgi:hypothetical protein
LSYVPDLSLRAHRTAEARDEFFWQSARLRINDPIPTEDAAGEAARTRSHGMTQYLILFGAHAMDHIADEDMPDVARAAHAVSQEAIDAGVFVRASGLEDQPTIVATDGTVTDGPYPEAVGGVTIVDVPTREEALRWAAKIAAACRCAVQVWEFAFDPELDEMLRRAESQQ